MNAKKILFINQEISPFVPESELSVLGKELPNSLQNEGVEIRTFMPKWGNVNERRGQLHEVIRLSGMNLIIDTIDHPLIIKVASVPSTRVQVYFIDNDEFFSKRLMGVDEAGIPYEDNVERAVFFARGALETMKKLRWTPDVVVCQGWMSAIVPIFIKMAYQDEPSFCNTKVLSILSPDGTRGEIAQNLGAKVAFRDIKPDTLKDYVNPTYDTLGQLAVDFSDAIVTTPATSDAIKAYVDQKGLPVIKDYTVDRCEELKAMLDLMVLEQL